MNVKVAKSAGFCFGVKRAVDKVYELADITYRSLSCTGMARIDFFVTPQGVCLNEVNTIPGFTSHSRYPSMMKAIGKVFTEVIDELLACALAEDA